MITYEVELTLHCNACSRTATTSRCHGKDLLAGAPLRRLRMAAAAKGWTSITPRRGQTHLPTLDYCPLCKLTLDT